MNLGFLGRHDAPAAFRFHPAQFPVGIRITMTHAAAVRHLVKAVRSRHRSDLDRLEQNIVARVSHIVSSVISVRRLSASAASMMRCSGFIHSKTTAGPTGSKALDVSAGFRLSLFGAHGSDRPPASRYHAGGPIRPLWGSAVSIHMQHYCLRLIYYYLLVFTPSRPRFIREIIGL